MVFKSMRYVSIRRLVFLVKRISPSVPGASQVSGTFFTQYCLPDVRPLKVFFNGFDVTKLLTNKPNLTRFSYVFLVNVAYEHDFKMKEVRAFFKVNASKSARKARGVINDPPNSRVVKRVAFVKGVSSNVDETIPQKESVPPTTSRLLGKRSNDSPATEQTAKRPMTVHAAIPPPEDYSRLIRQSKFARYQVFDSALKLVCLNVLPTIRFPQSRVEMFFNLRTEGVSLSDFEAYLADKYPALLTAAGLDTIIREFVSFNGFRSGDSTLVYKYTGTSARVPRSTLFKALDFFA